jgi:hypothetical protein
MRWTTLAKVILKSLGWQSVLFHHTSHGIGLQILRVRLTRAPPLVTHPFRIRRSKSNNSYRSSCAAT